IYGGAARAARAAGGHRRRGGDRRRTGFLGRFSMTARPGSCTPARCAREARAALLRRGALLALAVVVAGCATSPPEAQRTAGKSYAFVVLGVEGQPVARVITPASECPVIHLDGKSETMDVRARPATVALRPTRSERALSKPSV